MVDETPTHRPSGNSGVSQVRTAANALKAAIDAHLATVENRDGDNDPRVQAAYDSLAAAAESYDEELFTVYEEVTPFGEDDDSDSDDDDDDDDDDDLGADADSVIDSDDDLDWDDAHDEEQ